MKETKTNNLKILYFSSVNWNWIKQRPHFVCEGLAKYGYRVDYFSMTPFGKQKLKKVNATVDNLSIKDMYAIPMNNRYEVIHRMNKRLVRKKLNLAAYDIIFFTHPLQIQFFDREELKNTWVLYDCMDNISEFYTGMMKEKVIRFERELCQLSKDIVTSSCTLKKKIVERYELNTSKVTVIRNAVDQSFASEEFRKNVNWIILKKPCMMYIGTIEDWIDFDLLNKLLRENPMWTLYMVGPYRKEMKDRIIYKDRALWLGKKEHKEIPALIEAADIMVIPFKRTELIECVDPVKMYEFIAMNKVILSTYWSELEYFIGYKKLCFSNLELRSDLYAIFSQEYRKDNQAVDFINDNMWDKRIKEYNNLINRDRR